MSALAGEVVKTLEVLYGNTDNESLRKQANGWLQDFQKSPLAWEASVLLLQNSDTVQVLYFAASTLKLKIIDSFEELPNNSAMDLKNSLLQLISKTIVNATTSTPTLLNPIITTQLSLGLAAMAVQMENWTNAIEEMSTILLSRKDALFPHQVSFLIEFITVLPEECDDDRIRVSTPRRNLFHSLLCQKAQEVLTMLHEYFQIQQQSMVIQEKVFKCVLSWLKSDALNFQLFISSPFLGFFFTGLNYENLFEMSVDAIAETLSYLSNPQYASQQFIEQIMIQILLLREAYLKSVKEEDEEVSRGYCRIFVEAGEALIGNIVVEFEKYQPLLQIILDCSGNSNLEIAQITYNFWYILQEQLRDLPEYKPKFSPCYTYLVRSILQHLRFPQDQNQESAQQRDEFREFRHVVGDTLKDCCEVISGVACLQIVYEYLISETQKKPQIWQNIEAGLFAIRSMAAGVDMEDTTILPNIMQLLLSNAIKPHPKISYTITLIFGRYSEWSKRNPSLLQPQIEYIINGFSNPEISSASALALKYLTQSCHTLLQNSLPSLLNFHSHNVSQLKIEDILEITEAIANLTSGLPTNQASAAIKTFSLPILQNLHDLSLIPPNVSIDLKQIVNLLKRLTIFVKHLNIDVTMETHPLLPIFTEVWPILERIFDKFGGNVDIAEHLSRCVKYTIKVSPKDFIAPIEPITAKLVLSYKNFKQSPYLYACKEIVYQYGGNPALKPLLIGMLTTVNETTFQYLQTLEAFTAHPDIIEDYFSLMTEYCETCLLDILPFIAPIFEFGLKGISFRHSDANVSTILFFYRLFAISKRRENQEQSSPVLKDLVLRYGSSLIQIIFNGLVSFPSKSLQDVSDILRFSYAYAPTEVLEWIKYSISLMNQLGTTEKEQISTDVQEALDDDRLHRVLRNFASLCRKRK